MVTVFETSDMQLAQHVLSQQYGSVRLSVPRGDRHVRLEKSTLGPVELHRATFRMHFGAEASPLQRLAFGRVRGGAISYSAAGECRHYAAPGEVFLAVQPEQVYTADVDTADLEFAFLDQNLLTEVADASRPIRFTGHSPVSAAATRWWNAAYSHVRDNMVDNPVAGMPLLVGNAARLLAATALSAFPNDAGAEPTIEDRHDAHPAALRRAITYIEANAHRDVSPAEIAAAAHLTIRALYLAFRRHLETTPVAYLRRVRLHHAHRDLLAADPARTTVRMIAARWGFADRARFATHYRNMYGALPSDTLRR